MTRNDPNVPDTIVDSRAADAARPAGKVERVVDLEASNRSLERHVRALSQDLRSPLASTISGLKLLEQFGDRLGETERGQILERSIARLTELVDQMDALLDEATIDRGDDLAPTDPSMALQWVLATLDRADSERLTTVIDEMPAVMARQVALRQIMQNLVSNTLRHNTGHVTVQLTSEHRPDGWLAVHLDDDGAGFPADIDRLRKDGVSGAGSTGLGLATIDLAMKRLRGKAILTSSPAGGARVTLMFQAT